MASSEPTMTTKKEHGSPAPDTSITFKIVKVKKSDGSIITVKRRISSSLEDSPKKHVEAPTPDPLTLIPEDKPAEIKLGDSKPSISGVLESGKAPNSSSRKDRKARHVPKPNIKTATKSSKRLHRLSRPFSFAFNKIGHLWSRYDSDLSDVGTNADGYSDGSADSDNDSLPSSDQGRTQRGKIRYPGLGRMPRDSSQIFTHNPSISEDIKEKSGVQVGEQPTDGPGQLSNAQPHGSAGRRIRKRAVVTQFGVALFTIGAPLLFILLGILAIRLNGKEVGSASGTRITEAIKVGVTFWPIVFAAVISQSLKALAAFRVERGIRLMTLEQLISSHSVGHVIKQPFVLRKVDLIGLGLLCLWSLSPLASQAMQRMLYQTSSYTEYNSTASYLDTTTQSLSFKAGTYGGENTTTGATTDSVGNVPYSAFLDALYSAAFLPPVPTVQYSNAQSHFDGWGNTRIPRVEFLGPNLTNWVDVSDVIANYSSLYGIPIVQTQPFVDNSSLESAAWDFTLDSAYWDFNCSSLVNASLKDLDTEWTVSPGGTLYMAMNFTTAPNGSFSLGHLYFGSTIISKNGGANAFEGNDTNIAYSECDFTQTFVQTNVSCATNMTYCEPTYMRLGPADHPPTITPTTFTDWLVYASADTPSLTERYILNTNPADEDAVNPDNGFSLLHPNITREVFTTRLAIVVNTFWTIGFAPMYMTGGLTTSNHVGVQTKNASVTGFASFASSNIYTYSPPWIGVLFVCSTILVLFGIANIIWESRTIGPNVLGFASSVVRNSRYIDAPRMSSAMSGPEKARLLGDLKVMMQDVRADAEVGKIVLGSVNGAQRLKPGRLYK